MTRQAIKIIIFVSIGFNQSDYIEAALVISTARSHLQQLREGLAVHEQIWTP